MAKNKYIGLKRAAETDIVSIMTIIKQAQAYLKAKNIDQWQNNYPNKEVILKDIKNNNSYVLVQDDKVIGTTAIIFDKEPTYDIIYKGQWLSSEKYLTIHRIAIHNKYKGSNIASLMIKQIEQLSISNNVFSVRVDTHKDNVVMHKFLLKNGFILCGTIVLADGNKRQAYEKLLR